MVYNTPPGRVCAQNYFGFVLFCFVESRCYDCYFFCNQEGLRHGIFYSESLDSLINRSLKE